MATGWRAAKQPTPVIVRGIGAVLDVTLSLDTNAYAAGDVLAATQSVTSAFAVDGGIALLQTLHVLDEDDQAAGFDLIFFDANVALGTENSAPDITDANARNIIGMVSVSAGDYIDIGGSRIATKTGLGLQMKAASDTTTLYVAAITRGTPTHSASGLRLKLGMIWD